MNARSRQKRHEKHLGKWFFFVLLIVLNFSLVYRLLWGQQSFLAYHELATQYASIEQNIGQIDQENATISQEIRLLQTNDRYMEKMIRHRLNYVRDNEVLYLFDEYQEP